MSIDFTPGIINTYHGDIYNCTTNTDNVKTPDTSKWPCDNWEEQQPINSTSLAGVSHFRVELYAIEAFFFVSHNGKRAAFGAGYGDEVGRDSGNFIAVDSIAT